MNRAEVLHWSPGDYLRDHKTARLTAEEHGCYCLLLFHMWLATDEQCVFPLDYTVLGGIWHMCPEGAERILDSLMLPGAPLCKIVARKKMPYLLSPRLQSQAEAAKRFASAQSVKGKRSGAARRAKSANPGSTPVQPRLNPIEPSFPRTPVLPVLPVDPSKTPGSSSLPELPRSGAGSLSTPDDPATTLAYFADKVGRDMTSDETRSVKRWVGVYGSERTKEAIGEAIGVQRVGPNLDYIGGCLKRWSA